MLHAPDVIFGRLARTEAKLYPKKRASIHSQIEKYRLYATSLRRQKQVMDAQYQIAGQQYVRDSLLFARQVISPSEHETSRSNWLQGRYALEGAAASLENLNIQIGQLEVNLLDLDLEQTEKKSILLQGYRTAAEQLQNAIRSWELTYRLATPITGEVTEDLRLIERFFMPLKKVLKEGF